MSRPVIYTRDRRRPEHEAEFRAAAEYFPLIDYRTLVKPGDLVIPRYSTLPFAKDLEVEVEHLGANLINTYAEHCYVADLANWVEDLGDLTPKTYLRVEDAPLQGPFIVKGQTNSRKDKWDTHMFAQDRREAVEVQLRLQDDQLFAEQKIYVREYVKLRELGKSIGGAPVTLEYRYFTYHGIILASGFYWANQVDEDGYCFGKRVPTADEVGLDGFVADVLARVSDRCPFLVVDVGLTDGGRPIVVELNDGCMSGLSCVDPTTLYKNLRRVVGVRYED